MMPAQIEPMSRPLILVVDDHQDTRELYADSLVFAGFDVRTARNGAEGFAIATAAGPALVVTDYLLGSGMTGAELCTRLSADPRTKHVPTLMVTGASQRKDAENAVTAGCAVIRLKPYLPDALERDVRALIEGRPVAQLPHEHSN